MEYLRSGGLDIELILIGGRVGRAQNRLERQIALSKAESFVHQQGYVLHESLPERLAKADIFIFASSCENMPNTLVEAMAAGLPIACSDRGPMPEVLQDGGVYFDPESPASIARAVQGLVEDPALRCRLSQRARQRSEEFSWSRCARETWQFLAAMAEGTDRRE
jgi:glycosyltransferase involved in cell wall biosynthesis